MNQVVIDIGFFVLHVLDKVPIILYM